jgi:predicted flap endonuclease-1-like 5' DNA nuclease
VFWIDHWLRARGVLARRRTPEPRASALSPRWLTGLQVGGGAALALCLIEPTRFFPLIWGVTALIVAPLNHRLGIDGWLAQWSRRQWAPTLRMLLAGLIAGGCWEFFNVWARARWIYTVPFFDELKLFEMPLLGFLGFPPFALECACVYRLLVWYRLAPAFGAFAQVGPPRGAATRWLAAAVGTGIAAAGWVAVDRVIVTSRTPRVADVAALDPAQRQALATAGVTHLTQLAGWGSTEAWQRVGETLGGDSLGAARVERLRGVVDLYLHQGIGTTWGNRLAAAGIASLEDLRGRRVDDVWQHLRAAAAPGPVPSRAQVKLWLQRLPTAPQAAR